MNNFLFLCRSVFQTRYNYTHTMHLSLLVGFCMYIRYDAQRSGGLLKNQFLCSVVVAVVNIVLDHRKKKFEFSIKF